MSDENDQGLKDEKVGRKSWGRRVVFWAVIFIFVWRLWPVVPIFTGLNLRASRDFTLYEELKPPMRKPTQPIQIYRGLKHPGWDAYGLCVELFFHSRKISHGHAFESGGTSSRNLDEVARLLAQPSAIVPWSGEKMCGGFHADYLFQWTKRAKPVDVLLCEGCGEVIIYCDGKSLRADLSIEVQRKIGRLLHAETFSSKLEVL